MRDVFTPNLGGEYTGDPVEPMFDRCAMRITGTRMRASGLNGLSCRRGKCTSIHFIVAASLKLKLLTAGLAAFSGRGEIPHRRYPWFFTGARERSAQALAGAEVSRSGEMPEPTVIVRMKEIAVSTAALLPSTWPRCREP